MIVRRKPAPGLILSLLALFVALGGTSYAVVILPANSVGTKQIRPKGVKGSDIASNVVTSSKVKDGSLLVADFKRGQLLAGAPGPGGPKGDTGAAGPQGPPGATQSSAEAIVGSWTVSVNRGPSLPPLKSLNTFTTSGGFVEIANGGATARSPSHGAWTRIGDRFYLYTTIFFRYDPANGAYLGTVKLRHRIELSADSQSYAGFSTPEFRDPDGNLLPGSNSRRDPVSGERINVEVPPDLP